MTLFSNTGKDFTRTINKFKEVFMSGKTSKQDNMIKSAMLKVDMISLISRVIDTITNKHRIFI